MVSLETWRILSLLDNLNSCFFRPGLPLNCVLDIVCPMRRRKRCAGPARFVSHHMIIMSNSFFTTDGENCYPVNFVLFFIFFYLWPLFLSCPSFTHFSENFLRLFFLSFFLAVPRMHANYISRFSFSIAISRRHIIKSRLACNRRMDYGRPALTITFVISYFWFFFIHHDVQFFFLPFYVCISCSKSSFLFNTISSLIFHHIFTPGIYSHHLGDLQS